MRNSMKVALAVGAALSAGSLASAGTVGLGEFGWAGHTPAGFVNTNIDDTFGQYNGGWSGTNPAIASDCINPGRYGFAFIGFKDLLPVLQSQNSGNGITVTKAQLQFRLWNNFTSELTIARVTTPWMNGAAGTNELANDLDRDNPGYGVDWVGGASVTSGWDGAADGSHFGSNDYTLTHAWSSAAGSAIEAAICGPSENRRPCAAVTGGNFVTYGDFIGEDALVKFDVTAMVQDMYAGNTNQGWVILSKNISDTARFADSNLTHPGDGGAWAPNQWSDPQHPQLVIEYSAVPEPASLGLLAIGAAGFLARRRRSH